MKKTKISWTDYTWNPWRGCKKVSPGCAKCYMFRDQKRYGNNPSEIVRTKPPTFRKPLSIEPSKIFTCSWSDFFIEDADKWRRDAWDIICDTPQHTYQILTKRPERIIKCLPEVGGLRFVPNNVWIGVSIESQDQVHRAYHFQTLPTCTTFISYEPALGPIDLNELFLKINIDWLISGGESGKGARHSNPNWFENIKHQCDEYGVAYWHKQNGGTKLIDGVAGGEKLSGIRHQEFPA